MALTVEPTVVPYVPILYSFSRVSLHQPDVVANRELAVQLHTGKGFFFSVSLHDGKCLYSFSQK